MRKAAYLAAASLSSAICAVGSNAAADESLPPPPPPAAPAAVPGSTPVQVDETAGGRTTMSKAMTAFAGLGYSYGFAAGVGLGLRFQWILVPDGFLKRLPHGMHDEFGIEPGFDYFHAGYDAGFGISWSYNEFTPLVGALWNIWINDNFAVYPKVDVGYRIASWSATVNGMQTATAHADLFPVYFQGAAGALYRFGVVSVRAEIGWQVLRAGVALNLF